MKRASRLKAGLLVILASAGVTCLAVTAYFLSIFHIPREHWRCAEPVFSPPGRPVEISSLLSVPQQQLIPISVSNADQIIPLDTLGHEGIGEAFWPGDPIAYALTMEIGQENELLLYARHKDSVSSLDGTRLALVSRGSDREVLVRRCDVARSKDLGTVSAYAPVAINSGGTVLATTGTCESVVLWNFVSGRRNGSSECAGQDDIMTSISFSPDDRFIASVVNNQATNTSLIRVWNLQHDQEIVAVEGVEPKMTSLAFSPDGTLLATAGADGSIFLWGIPAN